MVHTSLLLPIVSGLDVFSLPLQQERNTVAIQYSPSSVQFFSPADDKALLCLLLELHTLLRIMMPSWVWSLVVMSNMLPPSPGTMVYSTSAFLPMSKSWALILPTADPTAEDSGTRRWKKPGNTHISASVSFIISTWHVVSSLLCTCRALDTLSCVAIGTALVNFN